MGNSVECVLVRNKRRAFNGSLLKACIDFGFDYADLDWEYPVSRRETGEWGESRGHCKSCHPDQGMG